MSPVCGYRLTISARSRITIVIVSESFNLFTSNYRQDHVFENVKKVVRIL
jgi:hypothetical protein